MKNKEIVIIKILNFHQNFIKKKMKLNNNTKIKLVKFIINKLPFQSKWILLVTTFFEFFLI